MKKLTVLSLSLILLGAGCLGGSSSSGSDGGVFKTINAGQEWAQTVIVPTASGIGTLATSNILSMEMDPQDHNYLYVSTRENGMLYSEDGGVSWRQPRVSALKEGLIYKVEVDPTDVCKVYVAKGARLYATDDCMRSFNSEIYVDNRSGVSVVQVAVDWYEPSILWIGLSNGNVLKSGDSGRTWTTVLKTGDEISGFLINNTDSHQILVSTFTEGIYKTIDGGEKWEKVEGGLDKLKRSERVYQLIQSKDSSVVMSSNQYGLTRSTDFGATWEAIPLLTSAGQVTIRAVGIDGENPATIYYAANATFYQTTDGGTTWDTEKFPSSRTPRTLLVDPEDSSVLYIGVAAATK
ncbi:MAG: YCF48-related protein [Candidatus Uhrbacteria bacterium]|nr:YCF48-related protein [Candidatus Uhrbacteria bacterium]